VRLCECPKGPTTNTSLRDRRYCIQCQGWNPPRRHHRSADLDRQAKNALRLLRAFVDEYRWAASYTTTAGGANLPVRGGGRPDPTGNTAVDIRVATVNSWRRLAASFFLDAVRALENADIALGEARYAVDPGPGEHVRSVWHEPIPEGRPDLEEAHAAKVRRTARGDGYGTA
jgi:hypothetical protein